MDEEWDWMKGQWVNIWGTIGNKQISVCSVVWVSTIRLLITRSLEKNAKKTKSHLWSSKYLGEVFLHLISQQPTHFLHFKCFKYNSHVCVLLSQATITTKFKVDSTL